MTRDLNRIAETVEQARRVGEKVKETWATRNALVAIRDAKDPHTEAHRRFCNSESEFRSVIEMCKEPPFKRSNLNHLIRYYTGWAKMKEGPPGRPARPVARAGRQPHQRGGQTI